MSITNTRTDRKPDPRLPDKDTDYGPIDKAVVRVRELHAQRRTILRELEAAASLENQLRQEVHQELGQAIYDGADDSPKVKAARTKVTDAVQRQEHLRETLAAIEVAEDKAEQALIEACDLARGAGFVQRIDERIEVASAKQLEAVDTLVEARHELREALALKAFVEHYPEHQYRVTTPPLHELQGANGDPMDFVAVVNALTADAQLHLKPKSAPVVWGGRSGAAFGQTTGGEFNPYPQRPLNEPADGGLFVADAGGIDTED